MRYEVRETTLVLFCHPGRFKLEKDNGTWVLVSNKNNCRIRIPEFINCVRIPVSRCSCCNSPIDEIVDLQEGKSKQVHRWKMVDCQAINKKNN